MESPALSLTEWVVLGLVAEGPAHGFALSRLTTATGPIGAIWHVPRPLVYRALARLADLGLAEPSGREPGQGGPQRNPLAITPAGRAAVDGWLMRPVGHIREIRTELLVKLALLDRAGVSPHPLLDAQAERLQPIVANLRDRRDQARGFDHTVASWRYENATAALRLMEIARR
ncbi:PadR family transcriptional regulator [Sphaerisporangium corydalis]|uniref:PadR family transcriptional regulator n=1 Tax=Sphaerisporangium corydalis TaxID=1441875 RepID=A0ABV9ESU4_9ACTN|nr:PadR family transcriptional regulator [Sphaerisporangium corydalis]